VGWTAARSTDCSLLDLVPYKEKQAASVAAKALGLRRECATADVGGSLRAGTTAVRAALDSVKAGTARNVLVVASDCRLAAPRSALERNVGDGAAALLISNDQVAAELEHSARSRKRSST
jgi:3-hydroxy-3-methylglutaryl CoA synthase